MTGEFPSMSVVIPIFNRRELVAGLLVSLEQLHYPHDQLEIIIVDNGSTDGAWEAAEAAAERGLLPLQCFRNPSPTKLPTVSRNFGVRQATGEIVAFTDSDCSVTPTWLKAAASAFEPGVGIVYGQTVIESALNRPVLQHAPSVDAAKTYAETCNIFYRRKAIEEAGGFDESFHSILKGPVWGEDTDLAYRVIELGYRMVYCPHAVVEHKVVKSSFRSWLLEPLRACSWGGVVRRHPKIRRDLLYRSIFSTRMTALFDLLMAGLLLSPLLGWPALLAAVPFLVAKFNEGRRDLPFGLRLARVAGGSVRAFLLFCTLIYSSARYRTLVI